MTVTRTLRYVCGHQEAVRLTGGRVGVLPPSYTIAVPFECGGTGCRVCAPRPTIRNDETPRHEAAGRSENGTAAGA